MKKESALKMFIGLIVITLCFGFVVKTNSEEQNLNQVKNVILMIPDGTSISNISLARLYNDGKPLNIDELACGLVKTCWANGPITDSAPAATAMATGYKVLDESLSVLPDEITMPSLDKQYTSLDRIPVATILEGAQSVHKSTGLVFTSDFFDATPAAFSSHCISRKMSEIVSKQQVFQNIDVVLGGGGLNLTSAKRKDGENLEQILINNHYDIVKNKNELKNSTSNKIWGKFSDSVMEYNFFRDQKIQPSLAEMTTKAIEVLSKNKNGFFLMVEGSLIDWASHDNDALGVISEVLAFDEAAKVCLDFAKKDGTTALIIAPDHGNGGLSIGSHKTDINYSSVPLDGFINQLKKIKYSPYQIEKQFNKERSNIRQVISDTCGILDLTAQEEQTIKKLSNYNLALFLYKVINKRTNLSFSTMGHTGEEVCLYCYHPNNYRLTGVIQNTDISKYIQEIMAISLDNISKELFIPAKEAFLKKGATLNWNNKNLNNPYLEISKGTNNIILPLNKNIAFLNGKQVQLRGITIFNGVKVFVHKDTLNLLN